MGVYCSSILKFKRIKLSNGGLLFVNLKTIEDWTIKWGFTAIRFENSGGLNYQTGIYCSLIWKRKMIELSNWGLLFVDLKTQEDWILEIIYLECKSNTNKKLSFAE